jgi:CheY-like chemotaxis protein
MAEERAKCLAAGMVDHVTKPIEPRRLITALLRATPGLNLPSVSLPAVEASPSAVPPAPTFEPSSGEIDWPALYARFNGRDALIHRLAKTMLDSHQEAAEKFHRAMAELVFLSHGLKGTAGNFSALRVQNMAQQVLEAARLNDPQAFVDAEPLVAGLERVLNELRHYQLAGDAATVRPAYSTLTSGEENR